MRIWSLHPKYLDAKGLVALWRETLLAKHVLEGKTKGYKSHPQLDRFKRVENPWECINQYLAEVYNEALTRGYNFDQSKFKQPDRYSKLSVTEGQIQYERAHLLRKLEIRDQQYFLKFSAIQTIEPHPLFEIVAGDIEAWEVLDRPQ